MLVLFASRNNVDRGKRWNTKKSDANEFNPLNPGFLFRKFSDILIEGDTTGNANSVSNTVVEKWCQQEKVFKSHCEK